MNLIARAIVKIEVQDYMSKPSDRRVDTLFIVGTVSLNYERVSNSAVTEFKPGNGNDQNFQRGVFSARGGYFGFSAQGGYIPPSGKTGSSAFSVI